MGNEKDETFFSRWSRRKAQVRQEAAPLAPPAAEAEQPAAAENATVLAVAPVAAADVVAEEARTTERSEAGGPPAAQSVPPPTLDEVKSLTPASDFSRFVAPGVDSGVKNAAMRKLFTDPHFNVMDGLDTYIDDYGRADPIPKSMLRQMVQARMLGLLDDEMEEQPVPAGAVTSGDLEPAGGVDPTPSPPQVADRPESAPEALQMEPAHDAALQEHSTPSTERAAGLPEAPAA